MNKSKYSGITGDELANMLHKPSKYSKKEAEEIIEKAEELTLLEKLNAIKDAVIEKDCKIPYEKENEDFFLDIKTSLKDSEWYKNEMIKFEKAFTEENEEKLKLQKVLEIIKEKEVNIINFKKWVIGKEWSYNDYLNEITDVNTDGYFFSKIILTKKEFDLLKEVLK